MMDSNKEQGKVKLVVEVSGYVEVEVEADTVDQGVNRFYEQVDTTDKGALITELLDGVDLGVFNVRVSERLSVKASRRAAKLGSALEQALAAVDASKEA